MKKNAKYLPLYYEWNKRGRMSVNGLCTKFMGLGNKAMPFYKEFDFVRPTDKDADRLYMGGYSSAYWASDSPDMKEYIFTPLRQTIVLLMAALNDEL
jgi:hypothetical protein